MSDIKLFSIQKNVQELASSQVELEKGLQNLIESNMLAFFGVTFLRSEFSVTSGRIDSLGIDENNSPVIFEYKRSKNENIINQGLFYLDWLMDHKAEFKFLVLDKLGKEKADVIDWNMPCVMCIASDFTKFDEHAVNQMQRNIKLVRYKKYGNEYLILEFINAPQMVNVATESTNSAISKTNNRDKGFIISFAESSQDKKDIYLSLRNYILSLGDDVSENQLKLYVAFKKVKNIVCVEVYNTLLYLHLRLDPGTVQLKKGFIEDVRNRGHWGTGDLRIILKSMDDFEACKPLLDRAYNEN